MSSIWAENIQKPHFDSLRQDKTTDVLIIGGGMTGLLCAYTLQQAGVHCILCEADTICGAVTHNTTAKITFQHGFIYDKLISKSEKKAALYLQANKEAFRKYSMLCQDIDCDFAKVDSYVYSFNRQKAQAEFAALDKLGISAKLTTNTSLPLKDICAVSVENQGQFNPLKFAYALAEGLPIYEHTKIKELLPHTAIIDGGKIKARKIILATHFPILNKHGGFFLKLYQHRSYVLALQNAPQIHGIYVDEDKKGMSFRNYGDLLLLGGGGHRTGKKGGGWLELENFASSHFPKAKIVARWATQDCMTLDNIPYIGQYSPNTPDLYVATGFNKWGMTSSMVAATLLADMIVGKSSPYEEIFSPSRSILHPQLAVNSAEAIINLITPTVPRCPHMGCALKYNKQEHTWDCPCHGSRFSENGQLIDNPATDDKRM